MKSNVNVFSGASKSSQELFKIIHAEFKPKTAFDQKVAWCDAVSGLIRTANNGAVFTTLYLHFHDLDEVWSDFLANRASLAFLWWA